tara:strand:+ start:4324 stop:5271 length:948 start_codon:yes stop_codon:yes gene_type:complete
MSVKILNNPYFDNQSAINKLGPTNLPTFGISPLQFEKKDNGRIKALESSDRTVIFNEKSGNVVNVVKQDFKNFELAQYDVGVNAIEEALLYSEIDLGGLKREINYSHDGARMKAVYTIPSLYIDMGNGDRTQAQIGLYDSMDGSWAFNAFVGGLRELCLNGQVSIDWISHFKKRHTKSLDHGQATWQLADCIKQFTVQGERWKAWKENTITDKEAFKQLWTVAGYNLKDLPTDEPLTETLTTKRFLDKPALVHLWNQWNANRRELGENEWALYNACTHWATHAPAGESYAENIVSIKKTREDNIRKYFKPFRQAA